MSKQSMASALQRVLADHYALYLKTQNFHWNVEGARFRELHLLFEEQYTDLAAAIDTIAELIRGLGEKVPASFEVFDKAASIRAGDASATAEAMLKALAADQAVMLKGLQKALTIAQKLGDEVVAGFLIERQTVHRKAAWMLNSSKS